MNYLIRNFLLSLIFLPLSGLSANAADAPDVDYPGINNNFYIGLSVSMFAGDFTQNSGGNWSMYTDQPIWYDEPSSFGVSYGKYFYTTSSSRQAIEGGYINKFETEDTHANDTNLINQYKNIFTLDYLYLLKSSENAEFFGSLGVGSMEIRGGQYQNSNNEDDRKSAREDFVSYGAGLLYKLNNNYDIKLTLKYLTDTETDTLDLDGNNFTDRALGFENAYLASASILYNF